MKTIEEKARAYNEVLEKAKEIVNDPNASSVWKGWLCNCFLELKEPEDEKIRKGIFKALSKKDARDVLISQGIEVSDALAWLEKQGEKKPEENKGNIGEISPNWSEEDEKEMATIEHHLNNCGASITSILWLKSLKDRVGCEANCTTAKEWSEEDEHRIKDTIYFLDTAKKHYASTEELDACIDWLKSLTPQNRWKPSDEQMMALLYHCSNGSVLTSLYNDLNKLKEE